MRHGRLGPHHVDGGMGAMPRRPDFNEPLQAKVPAPDTARHWRRRHAGPSHGAFQATGMAVRVQARARPTGFVLKAPWKCADRGCLRMLHCIVAIFEAS